MPSISLATDAERIISVVKSIPQEFYGDGGYCPGVVSRSLSSDTLI
jgi:hypothetical protein